MKVSILTANLWLLPPPYSEDNRARLKAFIELARGQKPQIIALQEVWLNRYVDILNNGLDGYNISRPQGLLYNHSGLVTFTKRKPKATRRSFFKKTIKHNPAERLARKGYLKVKIEYDKKDLMFVNTHLYSPRRRGEEEIAKSQLNHLKDEVEDEKFVILAGDLNINYTDFLVLNNDFFETAKQAKDTVSDKNKYRYEKHSRRRESNQKIDYVLARRKSGVEPKIRSNVIANPCVSDHYPVFAEVEF